jgi:hypothetical protein
MLDQGVDVQVLKEEVLAVRRLPAWATQDVIEAVTERLLFHKVV